MVRSLYSAATGMIAQQTNVDTISNNIANTNTTGFKKSRAEFTDLLYQTMQYAGTSTSSTTLSPNGKQIGLGVKNVAITKMFGIGGLKETGNDLDIAIAGKGFFAVNMPNGQVSYTRGGSFSKNENGDLTTAEGYLLIPTINIPANSTHITIGTDGIVSVLSGNDVAPIQVGQITTHNFINPSGLHALGSNLFLNTPASGDAQEGIPGENGLGALRQGILEISNIKLVEEMTDLITAQRAYEANSKSITTSDEMLQMVNQLKR
jgi:flagellar basal-body rod protein FlgG